MKNLRNIDICLKFCGMAAMLLILLCGCGEHSYKERSGFFFDTFITVRAYDADDDTLDGAIALCQKYDEMFSRSNEKSDVWTMNHSGGEQVLVSDDTAALLTFAQDYAQLSSGRFDITCGTVTSLWNFSAEEPQVPEQSELEAALKHIGIEKMHINGNSVILDDGAQIDLGGVAKGYIADKLAEYLKDSGVENAVINLGGNVVVIGDKFGRKYNIGVQSPFDDGYADSLQAADCSVVTAGTYQRGFTLDGVYYHHILDLSTGMPAQTGLASVTVVSESSAVGDAMATTLFLLGADEGFSLAEKTDGIEAIFISETGEITKTSGLD